MFQKILISISSEYFPSNAINRGVALAEKFNSEVKLLYIIEEKTLDKMDEVSSSMRTHYEREETKNELVKDYEAEAKVIFSTTEPIFRDRNIPIKKKIMRGEFTPVIKKEIEKGGLVVMEFEKYCLLNYRLFEEIDIPIWIEGKMKENRMLAVCSNLAPNEKVPEISADLAKLLNYDLYMLYVVDTTDKIKVNKNLERSRKKSLDSLMESGKKFVEKIKKKGIKIELVKGSLEKETIDAAERIKAGLIIMGREQKKKRLLCRDIKLKMVERSERSLLFVN